MIERTDPIFCRYAKAANNFGDPDYPDGVGGKVDDIGCVVVQVA